jgi:hypothetical protein
MHRLVLRNLDPFFPDRRPTLARQVTFQQISDFSLYHFSLAHEMLFLAWEDCHNFYLGFWAPLSFLGGIPYFHKIMGRETVDDVVIETQQPESFFASTELWNGHSGI